MINKRLLSLVAAGILVLGLSSLAMAGIPDPGNSTASSGSGCLNITPAGNGSSLGAAGLTVTVTVIDGNTDPIPGYPFQDIWLDDDGSGDIALCQGGSVADANTNAAGVTTISGPIAGGGWTQGGMQVYLAGVSLSGPALLIDVNSQDINGDITVNLADLGDFAGDFSNGSFDFRSDFTCDGTENLADVGGFASANGESCP